jgi:hypothetical protein
MLLCKRYGLHWSLNRTNTRASHCGHFHWSVSGCTGTAGWNRGMGADRTSSGCSCSIPHLRGHHVLCRHSQMLTYDGFQRHHLCVYWLHNVTAQDVTTRVT